MISVVVCSVKPEKLENLRANIDATIGVEYEIVAVDNRTARYSLCAAYNIGAARAKFPYLCFAHEDIEFRGSNWATEIIEKLDEPTTGVIGWAGAAGKPKTLSTWGFCEEFHRMNYRETFKGVSYDSIRNPKSEKFSEVVTLDGLCLVVRGDVWREVGFDEVVFDGFHLYDLDFSTAVAVAGYRNYVCNTVLVEHFSRGSFDARWIGFSMKYHQKWADRLPLYVECQSEAKMRHIERATHRRMTYSILKFRMLPLSEIEKMVSKTMRDFPFRPDNLALLWKLAKLRREIAKLSKK